MSGSQPARQGGAASEIAGVPRVRAGASVDEVVQLTRDPGAVVVEGWLDDERVAAVNREIDEWLDAHAGAGQPDSGSPLYDLFLGHRTLRLHGLVDKLREHGPALIADPFLVRWAGAALDPVCTSILLNAGELIQIGPGESAQYLHRDSDSWPALTWGGDPIVVNAIVALDDCTVDNGATHVAPSSHGWPATRVADERDLARATMVAGDVLLFRGDLIHRGGANTTAGRRRVVSLSYCAGWLRPVEHHAANVPLALLVDADPVLRELLGWGVHDATSRGGGILGLVDGGRPAGAEVHA